MKVRLVVQIYLATMLFSLAASFECGRRQIKLNKAIVHGQGTKPGDWPWHGAVYHRSRSSESYMCGATLISENFLLTAGHCVKGDNEYILAAKRIFVRLGVYNREMPSSEMQHHNVLKVHSPGSVGGLRNDIAILELETMVNFSDHVRPACINQEQDLTGQYGVAVGWGLTENDELSPVLRSSRMPVIGTNQCLESDRDVFGSSLDSSLFCVGYRNGTTVCNGDSGGGIHFERGGIWYVGGLVSFTALRDTGNRCRLNSYAMFTNVFHFVSWIWNVTQLETLAPVNKKIQIFNGEDPIPSMSYRNYLPRHCGSRIVNRIARGQRADLYEFPWMAILITETSFCMGTLISKRYVLSEIDCSSIAYQVELGDYIQLQDEDCNVNDPTDCAPPTKIYDIEYIVQHQHYDLTDSNDIALIRLKKVVVFDDHIQPVCLPVTPQLQRMVFEEYVTAGWGCIDTTSPAKPTAVLQKAVVTAFKCDSETIRHKTQGWNSIDPVRQICTDVIASNGPIACIGDVGGVLGNNVRYRGTRFVQYGITSFGASTCGYGPWIYTNVSHYMDWIRANMKP